MKKILAVLLLATMVFSTMALTSCKFLEIEIKPGQDFKDLLEGIFNPDKLAEARYTITKEEWDATMYMRNFTMVYGR